MSSELKLLVLLNISDGERIKIVIKSVCFHCTVFRCFCSFTVFPTIVSLCLFYYLLYHEQGHRACKNYYSINLLNIFGG